MGEIWFAATGPKMWLQEFQNELASYDFTINALAPNGANFSNNVRGLIEPVMVFRYIVPEPAVQLACRTLFRAKSNPEGLKQFPIAGMRLALGLDKVPEDELKSNWKEGTVLPLNSTYINIVPIGYKSEPERMLITGVKQEPI